MTRPTTISRQDEAGTGPRARWSLYRHSYKQNGSGYEGKHYITLIVFVKTWGIPSHQHTRNSHRHEYITAVGYPFAWKKKQLDIIYCSEREKKNRDWRLLLLLLNRARLADRFCFFIPVLEIQQWDVNCIQGITCRTSYRTRAGSRDRGSDRTRQKIYYHSDDTDDTATARSLRLFSLYGHCQP